MKRTDFDASSYTKFLKQKAQQALRSSDILNNITPSSRNGITAQDGSSVTQIYAGLDATFIEYNDVMRDAAFGKELVYAIPNFLTTSNTLTPNGTEPAICTAIASGLPISKMNGTYIAKGSHVYGGNTAQHGPQYSFQRLPAFTYDGWYSRTASNQYTGTGGAYAGSTSTTISGSPVLGEWLQITAPYAFALESYTVQSGDTSVNGFTPVNSWVIAGSNDGGITFTTVNVQTNVLISDATRITNVIPVKSTVQYTTYRIVVTANRAFSNAANVNGWNLFTLI